MLDKPRAYRMILSPDKIQFVCMDSSVAFQALTEETKSLILTSGTLAPLDSFVSELGCPFKFRLEAKHVINPSQVFCSAVSKGPSGVKLNSSYQNASKLEYQDELGECLLRYAEVVPDGVLVFFSSYTMLRRLILRWKQTGMWKRLSATKRITEEISGNKREFERSLKKYLQSPGMFLAVARGKISEGIDFADHGARMVIMVGTFPVCVCVCDWLVWCCFSLLFLMRVCVCMSVCVCRSALPQQPRRQRGDEEVLQRRQVQRQGSVR
jgi:Rad3-related DNA helicase